MRTARKALTVFLAAVIVLSQIPAVAYAAPPIYQPTYNEYPIFSAQARSSLDQFIGADGNSAFNVVGRFTKYYALGSYPDSLSFWAYLTENDYAYYQMSLNDFERRIASKNELGVALHAQITNDKHWSIYHFFSEETSANRLRLSSGLYSHHSNFGKLLHDYDSIEHSSSGTYLYADAGTAAFPATGASQWQVQGLTLEHRLSGDRCGAANTGKMAVMFADHGGPKVQSIYTTADPSPSSAKHERFKFNETIYVHLKFDEAIRLSTDNPAHLEGLTLNIGISDTKTGSEVGGTYVVADIVSLIGDTLTFECVVPASLSILGESVTTNHYLSSVVVNNQSWVTADDEAYDLTYVFQDGSGKHSFGPKDPANNASLTKTSSLITDFAGNPIGRSAAPIYLNQPCYMDNVPPTVASVTPVALQKNADSDFSGTGQTFMTTGDKIEIAAEFSEEVQFYNAATRTYGSISDDLADLSYGAHLLKAELNLKDAGGNPIVVYGRRSVTGSSGRIKVTKVTFELTIPPGARPIVYDSEAYALGINRITVDDAAPYPLCDSRGNVYDTSALLLDGTGPVVAPARQLWLDTLSPEVDIEYIAPAPGAEDFYVKVSVADRIDDGADLGGKGTKFASGSTGMLGKIEWVNGADGIQDYSYEYAYVSSPSVEPDLRTYLHASEDQLVAGLIQLPGDGLYIHFRCLSGQEYSIVDSVLNVQVVDKAGNTNATSVPIGYAFDNIGPVVTKEAHSTTYSDATALGEIKVSIRVKDVVDKVAETQYQWVERVSDEAPEPGGDWERANDLPSYLVSGYYKAFDVASPPLDAGDNHKYSLYVRTLDESYGELGERQRYDFEYDLSLPKHNLEFVTSPDGFHEKHTVIFAPGGPETFDVEGIPTVRTPTTITMIKVPDPLRPNEYYVKSALMPGANPAASSHDDIFDIPGWTPTQSPFGVPADAFEDWHLCAVSIDDATGAISLTRSSLDDDLGATWNPASVTPRHVELQTLMNFYYGDLDLWLIAAYEEQLQPGASSLTIPNDALREEYEYTLKSAFAGTLDVEPAHRFTVAPIFDDGSPEDSPENPGGQSVMGRPKDGSSITAETIMGGEFQSVQSLDGVKIKIDLANLQRPDWGLADLAGVDVLIYQSWGYQLPGVDPDNWDGGWGDLYGSPIYETRLPAVASQVFEIPAGVCVESGVYDLIFTLRSVAEKAEYSRISVRKTVTGYLEKATVGNYGVTKVANTVEVGGVSTQVEHEYALSDLPHEVYLSGSGNAALTFRAEFVPSRYPQGGMAGDNQFTRIFVRLTNGRSGNTTNWLRMSAAEDDDLAFVPLQWVTYGYGEVTFNAAALAPLGLQDGDLLTFEVLTGTGVKVMDWDADEQKAIGVLEPYSPPAQSVIVRMSDDLPALEMQLEPLTPTTSANGVRASVKSLVSPSSPADSITLKYRKGATGPLTGFAIDEEIEITENNTYYFFAYDRFGNVDAVTEVVDWIDNATPSMNVVNNSSGNQFDFSIELTDNSPVSLFLQHEESYWENVLGMADVATQDDVPALTIPGSEEAGIRCATGPSETGIYEVATTVIGDTKTVNLKGVFKYDDSLDPGATVARSIKLIAIDAAGNEAQQTVSLPSATNMATAYQSHVLYPAGGIELTFSAPVMLTTPALNPADAVYSVTKSGVPIYACGTYAIEYGDIFGQRYSESVVIDVYDGLHNVDVAVSETGPTRSDVVITIDATSNPSATLELPESAPTMTVVPVTVGSETKGATVTVTSNRIVEFGVMAGGSTQARAIPVTNIDRTPPTASVTWVFTDAVTVNPATGKGETKGEVIASLVANEGITGANGKSTTHRFTFGEPDPYVFEYVDAAGNPGLQVTADLSGTSLGEIEIVEKTFADTDGDAPTYTMAVFQAMPGGAFSKTAHYTQVQYMTALGTGNPLDDPYHVTRTLRLEFSVTDVNSTKLFVLEGLTPDTAGFDYENPAVDDVNGVSWSGNSVDITDNLEMTVVIVDANNNMTLIPVKTTKIDNMPPTADIALVKIDFYKTRAYVVNLTDALSATVTVRSMPGVFWDPAYGGGAGAYYHEFTGNGSFEFIIEDAAGNAATVEAQVTGIDAAQPAVSRITWSPSHIGSGGQPESTAPPEDRKLATNVVARIEFSKPLITGSCTATLLSPDGIAGDYFECTWGATNATVTFKTAAIVRLDFVAQNYAVGTHTLDGSGLRIDKIPPQVTVTSDEPLSGSVRSVTVTITSDEPAWELGSGLAMTAANGLTATLNITKNGNYSYRFADEVGNVAEAFTFVDEAGNATPGVASFTLNSIDYVPPSIGVTGFPDTRAEVEHWNGTHGPGDQKTHTMRNTSFTVTVTTNEQGTIAMGDEVKDMATPGSTTFTIGMNGRYAIRATDAVGNTTTKNYTVDCIDKTPPTIVFAAGTLKVKQGTTAAAFDDLLAYEISNGHVYAADNVDQSVTPVVFASLIQANLDAPGAYVVEYTAADSAGNTVTPTVRRTVLVYDMNAPTIFIQGIKTEPRGATIVNAAGLAAVPLSASMPDPGGGRSIEPFKLYYALGYRTVGEMKSLGERLTVTVNADPLLGDADLPVPVSGFYTLYLVTQSRTEYVTYVYVQK